MEVKVSHGKHYFLPKSLLSNHRKTCFPPHAFCLKSWATIERHRCRKLVKKWRLRNNTKDYYCTHVVKEGETLSSISKIYGVSVNSIALANKDIVDIDLVFKGQILEIPATSLEETLAKKGRLLHSIRALKSSSQKKLVTTLTSHQLPNAKATGYFLVLVPIIAFCIRCVISTFRVRFARDVRLKAENKSKGHHHGAKSMRWKSALSDTVEGDAFEPELGLDSNSSSEDEAYISNKEASLAYDRLQNDYQKFLSECGMSKWGYWRGGSPGA